ncbi:uncharacterized protein BX664DRAFT_382684 [Halteromyces radiatus]|uniref:uncharacterized protein n=1 Tax=Halteromyces radiatus TaxID=101107 RepID=UPI00221F7ACD|nr:uncharacterized protein BX664DRAFT_382684 [Halteromyces radiatus]KAI8096199.1 hypothetical protein BX664DRAFT_382684 [Halteromyces radiatus]
MSSGCSGIVNDYIYSVNPTLNGSYSITTESVTNPGTLGNCQPTSLGSSFKYSACTITNYPSSIVLVGTDNNAPAAYYISIGQTGCQSPKGFSPLSGVVQPVSVIPAPCSEPSTTAPCIAILGTTTSNVTPPQYIIDYPLAGGTKSSNFSVSYTDLTSAPPLLAVNPYDNSTLYVLGYPSRNEMLVKPNTYQSTESVLPSDTTNTITSNTVTSISNTLPTLTGHAIKRALPSPGLASDTILTLNENIEGTGPAISAGNNVVIVSKDSVSVQVLSMKSSSSYVVSKPNPLLSSLDASGISGIGSIVQQDQQQSTVWISFIDQQGNPRLTSSSQPSLFAPPSDANPSTSSSASNYPISSDAGTEGLSTGAIVGIVIGCVIGGILFCGLAFFFLRRRRQRQHQLRQHEDEGGITLTDQRLLSEKLTSASTPTTYRSVPIKDDASNNIINNNNNNEKVDASTAAAAIAADAITQLTRTINNTSSSQDIDLYEPTGTSDTLYLGEAIYSLHKESPIYAVFPQGYATRSATRTNNLHQQPTECTIHYFPATCATCFGQLIQTTTDLQNRDGGLTTLDAITLSRPTAHGGYQYIWITSPFSLHRTLYHLLYEGSLGAVVDHTQFSFKAWSTLSMLKTLDHLHRQGWIHRKLNLHSFFYHQASTVTDWSLTGFYQSKVYTGQLENHFLQQQQMNEQGNIQLDEFSAPEWILHTNNTHLDASTMIVSQPSMDIWSLGLILYTVATGKPAFLHFHDYQTTVANRLLQARLDALLKEVASVDDTYKELLTRMLQIVPDARDTLPNLINYWMHANQLDDDE